MLFTAYGVKFKMLAQTYMTIKKDRAGTESNQRKNLYFSMAEECHLMAAALKHLGRQYA